MEPEGFFQFEIIINVWVSCFRFIWIPMLWFYGHYKYLILSVRGSTLDARIWRLQTSDADVKCRSPRWKGSCSHPANTRHWVSVASMTGQRRRWWTSIEATLYQCLVFAEQHQLGQKLTEQHLCVFVEYWIITKSNDLAREPPITVSPTIHLDSQKNALSSVHPPCLFTSFFSTTVINQSTAFFVGA